MPLHRIWAPIRRLVLRQSIAIVANSDGPRKKWPKSGESVPVRVIPNGVDTDFFSPPERKQATNHAGLRVLFVGWFQEQKNLPSCSSKWRRLDPNAIELYLVGDGPQRKELENLAHRLGIEKAITWHGWLTRSVLRRHSIDPWIVSSTHRFTRACPMSCSKPWPWLARDRKQRSGKRAACGRWRNRFSVRSGRRGNAEFRHQSIAGRRSSVAHGRACARSSDATFSWKTTANQYANLFSAGASKT